MHSLPSRFGHRWNCNRAKLLVVDTFSAQTKVLSSSIPDTKRRLQRAANDVFIQSGRRNFT